MKKSRIIGLIFFWMITCVHAQILSTWKMGDTFIDFLGKSDSLFWIAGSSGGAFSHSVNIECYDFDLKLKKSISVRGANNENTQAVFLDSKILITNADIAHSNKIFSIQNVVLFNGENKVSAIEIFNINGWKEHVKLESESYDFFSRVSTTRKKILFVYENDFKKDYDNEIKVRVFYQNDSLSEIKSLKIPYSHELSKIENLVFYDSNGDKVIALVTIYDIASRKKRKVVRTELIEFDLKNLGQRTVNVPIKSDYYSCKLAFRNGKIIMGFLKKDFESSSITGLKFAIFKDSLITYEDINFHDSLSIKKRWSFAKPFSRTSYGSMGIINWDGQRDLESWTADSYRFRGLELIGDEKILAIIEKNYGDAFSGSSAPLMPVGNPKPGTGALANGGVTGSSTVYIAEDILLTELDISNNYGFVQMIKKKQKFDSKVYLSYLLFMNSNKANLVFTDRDEDKEDLFTNFYKVNSYEISDSISQGSVYNFTNDFFKENRKYRFQTKSFVKISDDTFVIAATIKGSETYLVKIKIMD